MTEGEGSVGLPQMSAWWDAPADMVVLFGITLAAQ